MSDRRIRSDSSTTELQMYHAEAPEPLDHIYLRECDKPYWDSIIKAKAYDSWNETDLENAAMLARMKADHVRLSRDIDAEGEVIENSKGDPIKNPKCDMVEKLFRSIVSLSRMLHVHAVATQGRAENQVQRSQKQREMKRVADNSLLAKPE